ncbi:hypothetical protein J1N35_015289 [Gossypium stocksii]|uniref:Transposase MuDR plant domain-containing protein n=1 Tax=Gossypium stocksii TaxID=47602 RepID=A0A9D3VWY6_9ROSI|nr:hypothetical protein J1N35_015289 [Gossypium stocksii]
MDDVFLTMSTSEGTSNTIDVGGLENEYGNKSESLLTESEDGESDEDEKKNQQFTTHSHSTHMHNVNLSSEDGLEFAELPYKRLGHASSLLDFGDLEVGKEFFTKDGFITTVKRYNINNMINFHAVKSRFKKFEAKGAILDSRCK